MPTSANPLISIVTVSRNAQSTIADTIASVARQRRDFDIEHICVDGESSDATRGIIDSWAAQLGYLQRIYEPDAGIFDAMNKGLRAATGLYVLFLNADDFLAGPDSLARAMKGVSGDEGANPDLIIGDVAMGKIQARGVWRHRRAPRSIARTRHTGLHPIHQGQFTKRALLVEMGGFDSSTKLAADTNQYYDLEDRYSPTIRLIAEDVAFMRAGGSANAGLRAVLRGSAEIFHHLSLARGSARAAWMLSVKTLQAFSELRYGSSGHQRWFSDARTENPPGSVGANFHTRGSLHRAGENPATSAGR